MLEVKLEGDTESEEEILVYVDFKDLIKPDTVKNNFGIFKAVGLNSDKPIVQLNNHFFEGEYGHSMGTNLFFKEDPDPPEGDPIFDNPPEKPLLFDCKTRKILNLRRVFLQERNENTSDKLEVKNFDVEPQSSSVQEALDKVRNYFSKVDIIEKSGNESPEKKT